MHDNVFFNFIVSSIQIINSLNLKRNFKLSDNRTVICLKVFSADNQAALNVNGRSDLRFSLEKNIRKGFFKKMQLF